MNDLDHWILIWRLHVCEASRLLCVSVYIHVQVWWWYYKVISHHKKKMKLFWHASMSSIFVREACYWLINKTAASRQTTKPKLQLMMIKAITLVLDKKNTRVSFWHFIICTWCMNTNESQHNSFANPSWASDSVHSHRGIESICPLDWKCKEYITEVLE